MLQQYINDFKREIIDTGFKRDLDDYIGSLPASQNNIVALRDIANKINNSIEKLYSTDLPSELKILLPEKQKKPFTEFQLNELLNRLITNKEIQQPEFFNQLTQILAAIQKALQQNITDISNIETFLSPYIFDEIKHIAEDKSAIISIVFKESNTISSLNKFTKNLVAWNKTLPIYHQLIKSESPQDIKIVEVQNGSIDFVINLKIDVALNLVELFKVGFQVFASYLAYKKMLKPIILSYHGNEKLISQEEEREKLLLSNIGVAIGKQIKRQHMEAKKLDKSIDNTALEKKSEQVTELISSHIVNGNDLKLLATPESGADGKDYVPEEIKNSLRQDSLEVRKLLRDFPKEDRIKLLEMYGEDKIHSLDGN